MGSFSITFTVITQPYGVTTIKAKGVNTAYPSGHPLRLISAKNTFFIEPNIFQVEPKEETVGTIVTVRGNGYGATQPIQIDFGTTSSITHTTTDAFGSFTITFTVDTQPVGSTTILAIGPIAGTAIAYFKIVPNITLITPDTGTVGTIITIEGDGYRAYEDIHIDFGTTQDIRIIVATEVAHLVLYLLLILSHTV
jgi:DNA-binding winged helix-turn-helix (wHTH) protein